MSKYYFRANLQSKHLAAKASGAHSLYDLPVPAEFLEARADLHSSSFKGLGVQCEPSSSSLENQSRKAALPREMKGKACQETGPNSAAAGRHTRLI